MAPGEFRAFFETRAARGRTLRDEAAKALGRVEDFERMDRMLQGLRISWRDDDPGKYGLHVFLASAWKTEAPNGPRVPRLLWIDGFHAFELMDGFRENMPHNGRTARLTGMDLHECTDCGSDALPVGTYEQVIDSPEGDLWSMRLYRLCLRCERPTLIGEAQSRYRMGLSRPDGR